MRPWEIDWQELPAVFLCHVRLISFFSRVTIILLLIIENIRLWPLDVIVVKATWTPAASRIFLRRHHYILDHVSRNLNIGRPTTFCLIGDWLLHFIIFRYCHIWFKVSFIHQRCRIIIIEIWSEDFVNLQFLCAFNIWGTHSLKRLNIILIPGSLRSQSNNSFLLFRILL